MIKAPRISLDFLVMPMMLSNNVFPDDFVRQPTHPIK